jgi:N-acetylneuraminic acid mutarotase
MCQIFAKFSRLSGLIALLALLNACSSVNTTTSSNELSLQTARYAHAAASDGKLIYVFAGSNGGSFLSDIEIINPLTGKVAVLENKVIPRRYFSAVWDGQHSIYLIGGISYVAGILSLERRVEVFDLRTQEVTFAKSIPEASRNSRSVFLDGRIYVFGGAISNRSTRHKLAPTSLSAAYDIASNKWIKLAAMPSAKTTAPIVKDGLVYVAGGYNQKKALNVFERYDPKTNKWQTLPALPRNISAHSMAMVGNKLVLFGDYEKLESTLSYDFEQKAWTEVDLGYQASRHNASVTIGNTVYVVGGNINSAGKSVDSIQGFIL